jgi:Sec7-like guanine-nucleotide exchange factor
VPLKELADPHKEFTKETINISKSLLRCSFEIKTRTTSLSHSFLNEVPLDLSGDRKEVTFTKSSKDHEEYYDVMSLANAVDKIFTFSKELPSNSVVNFVTALCEISLSELSESPPRMFMLQKIVEISYYNMERIRLEWVLIWKRLGDFFYKVGCMSTNIATFAVDSLRQLSIKYLERMELDNFNFQKDFLKPFEYIICHNKSPEIQELVIHCLMHISRAQTKNLRSGWKSLFYALSVPARSNVMDFFIMASS